VRLRLAVEKVGNVCLHICWSIVDEKQHMLCLLRSSLTFSISYFPAHKPIHYINHYLEFRV